MAVTNMAYVEVINNKVLSGQTFYGTGVHLLPACVGLSLAC
jgi:hypothetical protein